MHSNRIVFYTHHTASLTCSEVFSVRFCWIVSWLIHTLNLSHAFHSCEKRNFWRYQYHLVIRHPFTLCEPVNRISGRIEFALMVLAFWNSWLNKAQFMYFDSFLMKILCEMKRLTLYNQYKWKIWLMHFVFPPKLLKELCKNTDFNNKT